MKYIDARTQGSLKQGLMESLNLSTGVMIQVFGSVYEDTEREGTFSASSVITLH